MHLSREAGAHEVVNRLSRRGDFQRYPTEAIHSYFSDR